MAAADKNDHALAFIAVILSTKRQVSKQIIGNNDMINSSILTFLSANTFSLPLDKAFISYFSEN